MTSTIKTIAAFATIVAISANADELTADVSPQTEPSTLAQIAEQAGQVVTEPVVDPSEEPEPEQPEEPAEQADSKQEKETVEPEKPVAPEEKEESVEPPAAPADEQKAPADEQKAANDEQTDTVPLQDDVDVDEIGLDDDSAIAAKTTKVSGNLENGLDSLVDIECDEATVGDVLRQFRKTTGANIICDDSTNLMKRVSVSLKRVPWLQGMTAILSSRGFRIEERDNIYRVIEDKQLIPVSTRTFTLNHASAKELADLFNATYGKKDSAGKVVQPIATSFNGANVVVVTSTDKVLADCEAIIKAVDKAVAQIYIEARFIELSNEAMHKLGMQWNSLESWGASVRNLSGGMEYNNGRAANYGNHLSSSSISASTSDSNSKSASTSLSGTSSSSSASSSSSPSSSTSSSSSYTALVPSAIGAATGAGRTAESMALHNARGFSGQLSIDDFRLAMSAFESIEDAKVFSNPKIIVSNGKEAKVDMTTKYPNVTIDSNYTGQNSQNLSISTKLDTIPGEDKFMFAKEAFFSWGIQLSVTPRISPDGLISVEIVPTISDCTGYLTVNSSQETDTPYTQYPIIEVKRLTTEFTMSDGATAVIGGLSKSTEEDVDSGIPYLRKIPWIGPKLFGWKSRAKVQKEIVVFVTIGIANPENLPRDIGLPKNAILGREYVRGIKLEPGDRGDSATEIMKLDMTSIDERGKKASKKEVKKEEPRESNDDDSAGSVVITPVDDEAEATATASTL